MGHWNFPLVRIYINNLNQYINPTKLKQTLRDELSIYGPILDVVAHKNIKMRGQAFVVFETLDSAQAAVNAIQSEKKELFGKVINVSFAKTKSDATVKKDGNEEEFEAHKAKRLQVKEANQPEFDRLKEIGKSRGASSKGRKSNGEPSAKKRKITAAGASADDNLPPNKLMLLQNLPSGIQSQQIEDVYSKFKGFVEVRLVAPRRLAFVEYETDEDAIVAKEGTQGLVLEEHNVKVTYAKK